MLAFKEEEAHIKEKRLIYLHNQWTLQSCEVREQLNFDISGGQIGAFIGTRKGKGPFYITHLR